MKHVAVSISGKVQGVFFRASTMEKAHELGITGFVRNERDGSVYIEAEGSEEQLEQFVAWCHRGPAHAAVEKVIVTDGNMRDFKSFDVRR
jgi:acylphosphatase